MTAEHNVRMMWEGSTEAGGSTYWGVCSCGWETAFTSNKDVLVLDAMKVHAEALQTNAVDHEAGELPVSSPEGTMRLALDADGFCWRVFDNGTWSMARTNPDNEPAPGPFTFYIPLADYEAECKAKDQTEEAFDRYGWHLPGCVAFRKVRGARALFRTITDYPCTCGYREALG